MYVNIDYIYICKHRLYMYVNIDYIKYMYVNIDYMYVNIDYIKINVCKHRLHKVHICM